MYVVITCRVPEGSGYQHEGRLRGLISPLLRASFP
jgi:hypothetical protein